MIVQVEPGEVMFLGEAGVYEDLLRSEDRGVPAPHQAVVVAEVLLSPGAGVHLARGGDEDAGRVRRVRGQ